MWSYGQEMENMQPEGNGGAGEWAADSRRLGLLHQTLSELHRGKTPRLRVGEGREYAAPTSSMYAAPSSSSSSSRRFPKRLGVSELAQMAQRLASASPPRSDQAAYIRLLASKDFDTQKLESKISTLEQHVRKRHHSRGKLEGSNIEGYISHHQDMVVLDTINKAKTRVEQDIETFQRTSWSWRGLMGSKMGIGTNPGATGAAAAHPLPVISKATNYSEPHQSLPDLPLAGVGDGDGAGNYESGDGVADFVHQLARKSLLLPSSSSSSSSFSDSMSAAPPFTSLIAATHGGSAESEQYLHTLRLLACMTGEATHGAAAHEPGQFFNLAFGVADPADPAREVQRDRSRLTDGALHYFEGHYRDEHDERGTSRDGKDQRWCKVYWLLRKGKLSEACSLLESVAADDSWRSAGVYMAHYSSAAAHALDVLKHLESLGPAQADSLAVVPSAEKRLEAAVEGIRSFLAEYREEHDERLYGGGGPREVYLLAVLRLVCAVDPAAAAGTGEECASDMPGNFDPAFGNADPDLESFLWAKLWFVQQKRLLQQYAAEARGGGRFRDRGDSYLSASAAPSLSASASASAQGETLLYLDVQEDGGAESFRDFGSPHHYVRVLLCCHRFGEAVAYLAAAAAVAAPVAGGAGGLFEEEGDGESRRHFAEAVSLTWALLYHGLLSAHVPLLLNPRAGLPPRCEELDAQHQARPVDLLAQYASSALLPPPAASLQKIKTVANMLTLLLPPVAAQQALRDASAAGGTPGYTDVLKDSAQRWRRREALGEAISAAHAAHADALEDLLLLVLENYGMGAVDALAVGPLCHLAYRQERDNPPSPLEVVLMRAGARSLRANHNVPAARYFYSRAGQPDRLCAEVCDALASALFPELSGEGAQARLHQRDFWVHAAEELRAGHELEHEHGHGHGHGHEHNHSSSSFLREQAHTQLHNLLALRRAVDAHYAVERGRGDAQAVLVALNALRLGGGTNSGMGSGGHLPKSLSAYGEMDRAAIAGFFAPLDPRARLLYDQHLEAHVAKLRA